MKKILGDLDLTFWMTLGRAVFAFALGFAILFWPDRARPLLLNFIGGFWIAGSLLSIRWGFAHDESRILTIIVGVVGVLSGLAVVGRLLVGRYLPVEVMENLLGVVAVLTGMLHMTGSLQVKRFTDVGRTRSGLLLGLFETVLGLFILFAPWREIRALNLVVIAWAMLGGAIILGDALILRRQRIRAEQETE